MSTQASEGRTVGSLGEFALIDAVTARLPSADAVLLGPGDDAAVLSAPDSRVVATVDLLVEGVHFRRDWSSAQDVGHKAAARDARATCSRSATRPSETSIMALAPCAAALGPSL